MMSSTTKQQKSWIMGSVLLSFMLLASILMGLNFSSVRAHSSDKIGAGVMDAIETQGEARVVIALSEPFSRKMHRQNLELIRNDIAVLQDQALSNIDAKNFLLSHQYQAVPALAGKILNEAGLYQLAASPAVKKIDLDVGGSGHLGTSVPLIGADTWHDAGNIGNGVVVAVLDSGLDTDHSDLASALIHQECFLDDDGSIDGVGLCPNGSDRQSGPGAAEDDAGHGTHVTGIIGSRGNQSSLGVAPGVSIVAIKVTAGPSFSGVFYYASEIVAALDFIINQRPDVQIINMSIGTNAQFAGDCDNATSWTIAWASAINTLRSSGVTSFASSGNTGSGTVMGAPACLSNVIAVGATDNSDNLASFTDSNSSTDILAPGVSILSSAIGDSTTYATGTSMASPHAAGCAALLIAAGEAVTPDQIEARLETSPVQIYNPKNGLTFPRIDCTFEPNLLVQVEISGPATGFVGDNLTFTATSSPITATLPITYTWQATGQPPIVQVDGLSNELSFTWELTGTQTITVSAANIGSVVTNTHSIQVLEARKIYLPIMLK